MRIHEIINENVEPGWQDDPRRFDVPGGGIIIIGTRYSEDGSPATKQFLYYDRRNRNQPLFSIRVEDVSGDKKITQYFLGRPPRQIFVGKKVTVEGIQNYFAEAVSQCL